MKDWQPKKDHTDAEKIAAFDRLQKFALKYCEAVANEERFKDVTHCAYEHLLEATVANLSDGRDVWSFINSFDRDDG